MIKKENICFSDSSKEEQERDNILRRMVYLYTYWIAFDGIKKEEFYFDQFIKREIGVIESEIDGYGHNLINQLKEKKDINYKIKSIKDRRFY